MNPSRSLRRFGYLGLIYRAPLQLSDHTLSQVEPFVGFSGRNCAAI